MSFKLLGGQSGSDLEVEDGHRAARAVLRPGDIGSRGAYVSSQSSNIMSAGLAAGSTVWTLRYGGNGLLLFKKMSLCGYCASVGFTAGGVFFRLVFVDGYTEKASGGTVHTFGGGKKRSSHANSGVDDQRIAQASALTPGNGTQEFSIGRLNVPAPTAANMSFFPPRTPIFEAKPGDWPIVLSKNEGLDLAVQVPPTGTWVFSVDAEWEEVSAFGESLVA